MSENSIAVPKKNNAKHHVCFRCFKILKGEVKNDSNKTVQELPEAYLKRMAALKEREASEGRGSSHSHHTSAGGGAKNKVPQQFRKMDKPDRDIAMRLEKLKESNKPQEKVSDSALNERLAQLKGQTYQPQKKTPYQPPDRRTQVEQVDDLIDQLTAEVSIDSLRLDPAKDVEARLAHLKYGEDHSKVDVESSKGKVIADINNTNQEDKVGPGGISHNDLGKKDKMAGTPGSPKSYSQNIGTPTGNGDEIDMSEINKLMEATAKQVELDAQKAIQGMQQDKALMAQLLEIQKRKQEKKNLKDQEGEDSDVDNTVHKSNEMAGAIAAGVGVHDYDEDEEEEEDDVAASKIIQRYLEEAKIDDKIGDEGEDESGGGKKKKARKEERNAKKDKKTKGKGAGKTSTSDALKPSNLKPPTKEELVDSDYDDSDELPYCCICTEDAAIRCRDCDLDLYCNRCFRECHREMGIMDHITTPYKAPKGYR